MNEVAVVPSTNDESASAINTEVELARETVEYLVKLTDIDRDRTGTPDTGEIIDLLTPGGIASKTAETDTVRLSDETVDVFKRYLGDVALNPDSELRSDDVFWNRIDKANATARRVLAEQ